jgi:hypothetical protein
MASMAVLFWRTWNGAVGTEHAAIAGQRLKSLSAALAIIKKLAGVNRHLFHGLMAALRTGDSGLLDHTMGSGFLGRTLSVHSGARFAISARRVSLSRYLR